MLFSEQIETAWWRVDFDPNTPERPAITEHRVLFISLHCRSWYLGERVLHWYNGPAYRPIPGDPPLSMLWTQNLRGQDLIVAQTPIAASHFIAQWHGYEDFLPNLLGGVPPPQPQPDV